jgi:hypothetical protein
VKHTVRFDSFCSDRSTEELRMVMQLVGTRILLLVRPSVLRCVRGEERVLYVDRSTVVGPVECGRR